VATNLDLVRSIYADWERGDYSSAEWADPKIEYVIADGPTPGSWTGLGGMAEGTREFLSAWEDYRAEVEDYRELDDERVLVLLRYRGRGKLSRVELEQVGGEGGAHLVHIHEGKVTRLVRYFNRDQAFADLGLLPEAGSGRS
jgi:ketosteroid isomerase-like protein